MLSREITVELMIKTLTVSNKPITDWIHCNRHAIPGEYRHIDPGFSQRRISCSQPIEMVLSCKIMSIITAQQFAILLDNNNFDEAARLLAEDCRYKYFEGNYQGPQNIVNLYRQNHFQALKIFDEMVYSSNVEDLGDDSYVINFTDKIRKGALWHEHNCYQILKVKDNLITSIEHCEIRGENEAMRAFMAKAQLG